MHTNVYFVLIYEYIYADIESIVIWTLILRAIRVSHPNRDPGLTSEYSICAMCVCVFV